MHTPVAHKMICGLAAAVCSTTLLFAPAVGHADEAADAVTTDSVRAALERAKRAPTGREASLVQPRGTTAIWFELAKTGKVGAVGLDQTSGSQILDAQARALVARARYAPFAAHAFDDAPAHRFVVRYAFDERQGGTVTVGPMRTVER